MNETTPPVQPKTHQPAKKNCNTIQVVLVTFLITFIIMSAIGVGAYVKATANSIQFSNDPETAAAVQKLEDVANLLKDNYYAELSDADVLAAMTSGLADEIGSRYTMYLTSEQVEQLNDSMSGEYVGIGALVTMNKSGLVEITEVLEGSPAQDAGIRVGDMFIEVDGDDVTQMDTVEEVAIKVKGEAGTMVDIVMYRPSESRNVEFSVVRKKITNVSIAGEMLTDTIGYIEIREFSTGVSAQFKLMVEQLIAEGAESFVFDLRNNSGGLATEVIDMLDFLLPEGEIATIRGREDGKAFTHTWQSYAGAGVPDDMRYAILINANTASASELFSGCLRDYQKAYLIGKQSFGKGSGTQTFSLRDGSAVNITIFRYYLPGGDFIEEIGLEPDLDVDLPENTAGMSLYQLTLEQDTQLTAGIEYLEGLE